MDRQNLDAAVDARMLPLRMITLALSGSIVFYVVVAWLVVSLIVSKPLLPLPSGVAVTAALAGLSLVLIGYLISRAIRGRVAGEAASGAPRRRSFDGAMQTYARSVVVAAAFREAAAVVGLTLSILTTDLTWVLLLSGATLISTIIHWPRRAAVVDWLLQQGELA